MVNETRSTRFNIAEEANQQPSSSDNREEVEDFDLEGLSLELKLVVRALSSRFNKRFDEKDLQIAELKEKVEALSLKMEKQERIIEGMQQERIRDTMVISGNVPIFNINENCSEVVAKTLREKLHTDIRSSDITGATRLGAPKQPGMADKRPIKFKFRPGNTDHRKNVQIACVTVKPNIFINELMTPLKMDLFNEVRKIKKDAPGVIRSCYASNGRIVIKRPDGRNFKIVNQKELNGFLQEVRLNVPNRTQIAT